MTRTRNSVGRKYHIAEPRSYSTASLPEKDAGVGESFPIPVVNLVETRPIEIPPPVPRPAKRAVWIVHGMGQQVPFETVDGLAEGIIRVAQPVPGRDGFEPRVRTVQIGDQTVQRVELDVVDHDERFELHLYEAYWAPVTEGEVKLSEVIGFLFSASFRGLLNAAKPFSRAMFEQVVEVKIPWRAAWEISLSLLTLMSLFIINTVILAAGVSAYGLLGSEFARLTIWHIAENWVPLSAIASCLSALAIAFGLILFLAELSHPAEASRRMASAFAAFVRTPDWKEPIAESCRRTITITVWIAFGLTLTAMIAGALALAIFAIFFRAKSSSTSVFSELQAFATLLVAAMAALAMAVLVIKGFLRSAGKVVWSSLPYEPFFILSMALFVAAFAGPVFIGIGWTGFHGIYGALPTWVGKPFWVWPLLLLVSWMVRTVMVEYVGDVTAYVTSQTLDRFNEIRQHIKQIALESAQAVYLAKEEGEFLYDRIAVLGHSLGSVIAYDTLNTLLDAERLGGDGSDLKIAERTCLFETFGSPLDKIAFFFSFQGKDTFHIREQLATAVQPLISNYEKFRTFPWINIYSPNDIISGKVRLYDLPLREQSVLTRCLIRLHRVRHFKDPDAIVPVVAHVDYWKNREVWTRLLAELTRKSGEPTQALGA